MRISVYVCALVLLSLSAHVEGSSNSFDLRGWDLRPAPRARTWGSGNTDGYNEGESVPLRIDVREKAGTSFVTVVHVLILLRGGPARGGEFLAIDQLENPLDPTSRIPNRARPVAFPSGQFSEDGPFVCWGGSIEVVGDPVMVQVRAHLGASLHDQGRRPHSHFDDHGEPRSRGRRDRLRRAFGAKPRVPRFFRETRSRAKSVELRCPRRELLARRPDARHCRASAFGHRRCRRRTSTRRAPTRRQSPRADSRQLRSGGERRGRCWR